MEKKSFFLLILSIVLGILGGIIFPQQMLNIEWIGVLFINSLKLIVLPLIFSSLVSAITHIGNIRKLGSIGGYTVGYILTSVSIAIMIGLTLMNIVKPGVGLNIHLILTNEAFTSENPLQFSSFILSLFPPNLFDAALKFEIMPIAIFSIVFGIASISSGKSAKPVVDFFIGLKDIFIKMISWLMLLTPIGLFSLLGAAIAGSVKNISLIESINKIFLFILVFLCGLLLQAIWQCIVIRVIVRKNVTVYIKAALNALATAFATSSSMATLPVTLMVAKNEGINDDVARFILPFATTINLAGTAMYEAVSALFFCQILGIHLSIISQIGLFLASALAGMGATGIPEGGIVTMITVLRMLNIPTSAIALLLPFDRILDRFRTVTNVWGDLVCAATVDALLKKNKKVD